MRGGEARIPWNFRPIAWLAFLWAVFRAYDYLMTQTRQQSWFEQTDVTTAQLALFKATPWWAHALWAVEVWVGLLGAWLLLRRRKSSVGLLVLAMLCWASGLYYLFAMSDGTAAVSEAWGMQIFMGAVTVFLPWYAWTMTKKGHLR